MLINKKGNLLEAEENIICHQVNIMGSMGGGLALQIAKKYPTVEQEYNLYCKKNRRDYKRLQGKCFLSNISEKQMIANCFTQQPNFDTDLEAIERCFGWLLLLAHNKGYSVAIPKNYGAGIANGDWAEIKKVFERLSENYEVDITVYELEEK